MHMCVSVCPGLSVTSDNVHKEAEFLPTLTVMHAAVTENQANSQYNVAFKLCLIYTTSRHYN